MADIVKYSENKCQRQIIINHFSVSDPVKFNYDVCKGCQLKLCKCGRYTCYSVCAEKCPCEEKVDVKYATEFLKRQT